MVEHREEHNNGNAKPAPNDRPPVLLMFEGLLVGCYNQFSRTFQVGVIPAPEHQFTITIKEFQDERVLLISDELNVRIPIAEQQIKPLDFPLDNRMWSFEIEQEGTPAAGASQHLSGTKPNRHAPPQKGDEDSSEAKDIRWALSLDVGEMPDFPSHGTTIKHARSLNPIINFKHGCFYNRGLIRSTVYRKREGRPRELLGAISDRVVANVDDIRAGSRMILRTDNTGEEFFNLQFRSGRSFSISFQNTPLHEHGAGPGIRSHFQLFYMFLNVPSANRYDLLTQDDGFPGFPSRSTEVDLHEGHESERGAPSPYRCGIGIVEPPLD